MPSVSFSRKLNAWYRTHARDLPWRRTTDPYKIWISEVMLQQTTVNAVIPYYQRWIQDYPDIAGVARAPEQAILKSWQGLGYYQRAKNIRKAAQVVCASHQGKIPDDPDTLRSLPGFGPYTAGAVASIAFDRRVPIVDANVRRVVLRRLADEGKAGPVQERAILSFLNRVMPAKNNDVFNQALMELGALVCRRRPLCLLCPVRSGCRAYAKGIQEIIPPPKKTVIRNVDAVVGVIRKGGKYFLQKRSPHGLLADLWEFPGGKIETGESAEQALRRELREELGVAVKSCRHLMDVQHAYTQFRVNLKAWLCVLEKAPAVDAAHQWVAADDLEKYPMPSGSARIVDRLLAAKKDELNLDKG